jgi:hypothetical protein
MPGRTLFIALVAVLAACSAKTSDEAVDTGPAASAAEAPAASYEASREPSTANPDEAPGTTASSAAAAAPECKDISQTRPGACDPKTVEPTPPPQ